MVEKVVVGWEPPKADGLKLNVDAAFLNDKAIIAVVARNSSGSILKA